MHVLLSEAEFGKSICGWSSSKFFLAIGYYITVLVLDV